MLYSGIGFDASTAFLGGLGIIHHPAAPTTTSTTPPPPQLQQQDDSPPPSALYAALLYTPSYIFSTASARCDIARPVVADPPAASKPTVVSAGRSQQLYAGSYSPSAIEPPPGPPCSILRLVSPSPPTSLLVHPRPTATVRILLPPRKPSTDPAPGPQRPRVKRLPPILKKRRTSAPPFPATVVDMFRSTVRSTVLAVSSLAASAPIEVITATFIVITLAYFQLLAALKSSEL